MAVPDELPKLADEHYRQQADTARVTAEAAEALWARLVDPAAIIASYKTAAGPAVVTSVQGGQQLAAADAAEYVAAAGAAWGTRPPAADPDTGAFMLDAAAIDAVCFQAPVEAVRALAAGDLPPDAVDRGRATLVREVATLTHDAGREAAAAAIAANPDLGGYYRKLAPPSCGRCAVQAGKWFRWNQGFARHPLCDCVHVPAAAADDSLAFDPDGYFASLSETDQDRYFGASRAARIRAGVDLGRVVNDRMPTPGVRGRRSPTDIIAGAASRDEAVAQLRRGGYLTTSPTRVRDALTASA